MSGRSLPSVSSVGPVPTTTMATSAAAAAAAASARAVAGVGAAAPSSNPLTIAGEPPENSISIE